MTRLPNAAILAGALLLQLAPASSLGAATYKTTWSELEEGLTKVQVFADLGQETFYEVNGVSVDPRLFRLQVVFVPDLLSRVDISPVQIPRAAEQSADKGKAPPTPNLEVLAQLTLPLVALNGGYRQGSWSLVVPAGLLAVDGLTIYPLNETSKRQSGVVCLEGGEPRLLPTAEAAEADCSDAVQAGPFIVDPGGAIGISKEEPEKRQAYRRSFVCLRENGQVLLAATTEVHLRHLAEMLTDPGEDPGLRCERALNLSGDAESGIMINDPAAEGFETFGETSVPLASALIATRPVERGGTELAEDAPVFEKAGDFFKAMVDEALDVVDDRELSAPEKDDRLLALAFENFAVEEITRVVLGSARRDLEEETLDTFEVLYARWLIKRYLAGLYDRSQSIDEISIIGAREQGEEQLLLETELRLQDKGATRVRVVWRLRGTEEFQIVDVLVEGLSMISTHRSEFSRIIFTEGLDGLMDRLRRGTPSVSKFIAPQD